MASTKLLFFDVDGTLVPIGGSITKATMTTLRELQNNGHKIFICTGRSKGQVYKYLLDFGFDGIVAGTGCYVEYNNQVIFNEPFSEDAYQKTLKVLDDNNVSRLVQSKDHLLTHPSHLQDLVTGFGHLTKEEITQEKAVEIMSIFGEIKNGSFENFTKHYGPVENICFGESPIPNHQLERLLPNELRIVDSSINPDNKTSGEIVKRNCTKGTAIEIVAKHLNVNIKDVIAFGDGHNDIDMIQAAGLGVSMGNAHKEVQDAADVVTLSCEDDGITHMVKKIGLI